MGFEEFLASVGLGHLVVEDFFAMQVGLLAVTMLLFISSLVASIMTFRSAGIAKRARLEARDHFRAAEDLAVEMRHLTAQVENAATRLSAGRSDAELRRGEGSAPEGRIRVGAAEEAPRADVVIDNGDERISEEEEKGDLQLDHERRHADLEAAGESSSVPSSLLRGLMRRR